jgi:hypothetical protein
MQCGVDGGTGMRFKLLYSIDTKAGTFYIAQSGDGRFHPMYNGNDYGRYAKVWQPAEDLAGNAIRTICHSATGELLDTSALGIPENLEAWERIVSASSRASATVSRTR